MAPITDQPLDGDTSAGGAEFNVLLVDHSADSFLDAQRRQARGAVSVPTFLHDLRHHPQRLVQQAKHVMTS